MCVVGGIISMHIYVPSNIIVWDSQIVYIKYVHNVRSGGNCELSKAFDKHSKQEMRAPPNAI